MYSETENYEIIMNKATDRKTSKTKRFVMLTVAAMMLVMLGLTFLICCYTLKAESHVRYVSILNVASERIAKTIRGMEMSAKNIFDEVQQHLDSPDAVIAALKSKTSQNPDIKGYFAAFEPNYFPQRSKSSSLTSTKARTTGSMWRVRWDQAKRTIRSLNCISKPRN